MINPASSTANSQLNLGYVTSHGATGGDRGEWRGTGAELRTDAWAVVRAGAGLQLSTTARAQAGGTLLDAHEARGQLTAAQKTAQRLSDAASSQQALPLAANEAFEPIDKALDPAQDGKYSRHILYVPFNLPTGVVHEAALLKGDEHNHADHAIPPTHHYHDTEVATAVASKERKLQGKKKA